jgi:hypothetical protein
MRGAISQLPNTLYGVVLSLKKSTGLNLPLALIVYPKFKNVCIFFLMSEAKCNISLISKFLSKNERIILYLRGLTYELDERGSIPGRGIMGFITLRHCFQTGSRTHLDS